MGAIAVRAAGELWDGLSRVVAVTCLLLFAGFVIVDPSLGGAVSPGVPASTPSSSVWSGDGFVVERVATVSGRQVAQLGPGVRTLHPTADPTPDRPANASAHVLDDVRADVVADGLGSGSGGGDPQPRPSHTGAASLATGSSVALGALLALRALATPLPVYLAHPGYRHTVLWRVSRPPTRPD